MARLVLLAAPLAALAFAGCGGGSSSSSTSITNAQQRPARPGRPNRDRGNSAQFERLRAVLQKCGVPLPNRGAPPPSSQGTPSTSAS